MGVTAELATAQRLTPHNPHPCPSPIKGEGIAESLRSTFLTPSCSSKA